MTAPLNTASKPDPRAVPLAKLHPLPSLREWAESRPAVDPVLVARLARGAK